MPARTVRYLMEHQFAASDAPAEISSLTAREAALLAGVNERTIRRAIARGELTATRQSGQFRIAPAALQEFQQRYHKAEASPQRPAHARQPSALSSLPVPPTTLIGRERDLALATGILADSDGRLLTLTGAGGVGKTRLALAVATAYAPKLADGAVFVALEAVREPDLIVKTIAQKMGVAPIEGRPLLETLAEAVRPRQQLLILDNFEHVLSAAPLVAELLAAGPGLRLLVTSREALRLRGERELVVPPLALPDLTQALTSAAIGRAPAVELFVRRARAVQPAFTLNDENASIVATICQRLDGLPLAIELAAARIKHTPPAALLERLERRLDTLTDGPRDLPQRLQTMRAAITWSYDLLAPDEQALFRRLSIFSGGFTASAAEYVGGDGFALGGDDPAGLWGRRPFGPQGEEDEESEPSSSFPLSPLSAASPPFPPQAHERSDSPSVPDLLTSLVDKSLLQHQAAEGEPRFTMLETIREFAGERLLASGEANHARARHAAYFLALAEEAQPAFHHLAEGAALTRIESELGNFRAALAWAAREHGSIELAIRLANGLFWLWYVRGYHQEGWDWYQGLIARPEVEGSPEPLANALIHASWLALRTGVVAQADTLITDALSRCRALHLARSAAFALGSCGFVALVGRGDPATATTLLQEARLEARAVGDAWLEAMDDYGLSIVALAQGDLATAQAMGERSLAVSREHGDMQGTAADLAILGQLARFRGEAGAAMRLFAEALEHYQRVSDRGNVCTCVEALAGLLISLGRPDQGVHLLGAAAALRQSIGTPVALHEQQQYDADVAVARAALTDEAFTAAWRAGEATSLREAVSGVAWSPPTAEAPAATTTGEGAPPPLTALTRREREVLELISAGNTDRQISQLLSISPATVTKHVGNVLGKLGVHSRTAAAIALLTTTI